MGIVDDDRVAGELRVAQRMLPGVDVTILGRTSAQAALLQGLELV